MEQTTSPSTAISKAKIMLTGELMKNTLSDYKQNWRKFVCLLILPMTFSLLGSIMSFMLEKFSGTAALPLYLSVIIGILAVALIIIFAVVYFHAYIAEFILLKDLSAEVNFKNVGEWYKKARQYFWTVALVSVIFTFLALIGFILFVIPGVIVCIVYAFAIYAVIYEDKKIKEAFSRSKELVKGYFWPVFGRFAAGGFLVWLAYVIIGGIGAGLAYLLTVLAKIPISKDVITLSSDLLSVVVGLIIGPLSLIYTYKIYRSLREIKNI